MTHTELKQAILGFFRDIYKAEFIGGLKIESLDPVGYKVSINLDRAENPVVIIADLPDDKFLEFIKEEIRYRKFNKTKYFMASGKYNI